MLLKTKGIVLGHIPFKENSIIVKIYTEEFGSRGFIQTSAKSIQKKSKMAYFIPLSLLDLVVYHKPSRDLDRISEIKFLHTFSLLPFETPRASIALFLSEVLSHSLRQEPGSSEKFNFLYQRILELDNPKIPYEDFPIHFLFDFSFLLGFGPSNRADLFAGIASPMPGQKNEAYLESLFSGQKMKSNSGKERFSILEVLLNFYRLHLENFTEIKSLPILHQVLS